MKVIIKHFTALLAVVALSTSCVPQSTNKPLETATLELSMNAIELSSDAVTNATTPLITIQTNQTSVKVQSLAPEWLVAECRGTGIYVTAEANKSGVKRSTNILVFAGDKIEVIKVQQNSTAIFLEVSPTTVNIPAAGETVLIDVRSNNDNWKFVVDDDINWLKVTRINNFLQVSVSPNNQGAPRDARVYVEMDGTSPKEITFNQLSYSKGSKFSLPLLTKNPTRHAILQHEKEQGSYLIKHVDRSFGEVIEIPYFVFLPSSPTFNTIVYYIKNSTKEIHSIEMTSSDDRTLRSDEFLQALKDEGFELKMEKNQQDYTGVSNKNEYELKVEIKPLKESKLTFTPIKKK